MKKMAGTFIFFLFCVQINFAQVHYSSDMAYGLRKIIPGYTGNAIQVRRSCDDVTMDIGFTSCGELDTSTLKKFVIASNPLSAITASSATAYSLRKLSCSYSGNAIQVRRSSDNATQDIGFTTYGDLDTVSLKTFIGSNSGYVVTWYDQSGNGRNASQSTNNNQPRIVNAGVIERQNNMPAIYFSGLTNKLYTSSFSAYSSAACFNGVAKVNVNLTYNAIVNKTNNNNYPGPIDFYNGSFLVGNGTPGQYNSFGSSQTFNSSKPLGVWTYQANGTTASGANAYYNGSQIVTNQTPSYFGDNAGAALYIGSRYDGVTGLNGWISEILTFGSIPSSTDRSFLEWSQGQYYNISGISLNGIPTGAANGYITTWYDQSGNNRNVSQSSTGRQPQIVKTGSIPKIGTKPSVQGSNALQTNLTVTLSSSYTGSQLSANAVVMSDIGTTSNLRVMSVGNSALTSNDWNNNNYFNINQRNTNQYVIERSGVTPSTSFTVASPVVLSVRFNGSNRQLFNNGSGSAAPADANSFNFNSVRILQSINPGWESGEALTGNMSEFSLLYSSLSTTRRTLIESNQSAFYNISVSNSKYTPPSSSSYIYYVNGVGRESSSDSVAGTKYTVGMGFSIGAAAGDFLKDNGDYITAGINCPITPTVSTSNLPATVVYRWYNDWYVNKTDVSSNNGNMSIFFDFSDYGVGVTPGVASNYVLLYRSSAAGTFTIVPGTSVSVSGDRVLFSVDASNITTNYYYTIGTKDASASPLPIELLNFQCQLIKSNQVQLKWSTASEYHSDHFNIERSEDGINFETIGKIQAAGISTSLKEYQYLDEFAKKAMSYYRLKSIDADGSYKFSEICSVNNNHFENNNGIIFYPNPTHSIFTIDYSSSSYNYLSSYRLYDISGKELEVSSVIYNNKIILDVSGLNDGIYFVEILANEKKLVSKVTIQK